MYLCLGAKTSQVTGFIKKMVTMAASVRSLDGFIFLCVNSYFHKKKPSRQFPHTLSNNTSWQLLYFHCTLTEGTYSSNQTSFVSWYSPRPFFISIRQEIKLPKQISLLEGRCNLLEVLLSRAIIHPASSKRYSVVITVTRDSASSIVTS